jgi:hypothetical protein
MSRHIWLIAAAVLAAAAILLLRPGADGPVAEGPGVAGGAAEGCRDDVLEGCGQGVPVEARGQPHGDYPHMGPESIGGAANAAADRIFQ